MRASLGKEVPVFYFSPVLFLKIPKDNLAKYETLLFQQILEMVHPKPE